MAKKSTTLEFKGLFDVSDIISKVKSLQSVLEKSGAKAGSSDFLKLNESIKNMERLQSKINSLKASGYSSESDIKNMADAYRDIFEIAKNINKTVEQTRLTGITSQVNQLKESIKSAESEAKELKSLLTSGIKASLSELGKETSGAISNMFANGAKNGKEYRDVVTKVNDELTKQVEIRRENLRVQQEAIDKIKEERKIPLATIEKNSGITGAFQSFKNIDGSKFTKDQFAQVREVFKETALTSSTPEKFLKNFEAGLQKIGIAWKKVETIQKYISQAFEKKQEFAAITQLNAQIKSLENPLNKAKASFLALEGYVKAFQDDINSEGGNVEKAYTNLVQKISQSEDAQRALNDLVKTFGNEGAQAVKENADAIKNGERAMSGWQKSAESTLKTTEAVDSAFGKLTNAFERYFSATYIIRNVARVIRETFNDIEKLDKAFASIAMVTDKTVADLWNSYGEYQDIANKLGQSTESAIKASALYYQQGLDTAEALKLTEDTMKLATLAGADFETATRQMTAALRGFHMEMGQGAHITDVYSELAANAAADVNGIAYAMSKAASIADSAGMSFETTAAFITNMIETTQEAPENIG